MSFMCLIPNASMTGGVRVRTSSEDSISVYSKVKSRSSSGDSVSSVISGKFSPRKRSRTNSGKKCNFF